MFKDIAKDDQIEGRGGREFFLLNVQTVHLLVAQSAETRRVGIGIHPYDGIAQGCERSTDVA